MDPSEAIGSQERIEYPNTLETSYGKTVSTGIRSSKSLSQDEREQTVDLLFLRLGYWTDENNYELDWEECTTDIAFEILNEEKPVARGEVQYEYSGCPMDNNSFRPPSRSVDVELEYREDGEELAEWLENIAFWQ